MFMFEKKQMIYFNYYVKQEKVLFYLENGILGDIFVYCLFVIKKRNNNYGYICIIMGMKEKKK